MALPAGARGRGPMPESGAVGALSAPLGCSRSREGERGRRQRDRQLFPPGTPEKEVPSCDKRQPPGAAPRSVPRPRFAVPRQGTAGNDRGRQLASCLSFSPA